MAKQVRRTRDDGAQAARSHRAPRPDCYVQLPLIFIAFLRAEGWTVAAYSHKSDPGSWCVKVKKDAVITIDEAGRLVFKGVSPSDVRTLSAVRDRAAVAFAGLMRSRRVRALSGASPRAGRITPGAGSGGGPS